MAKISKRLQALRASVDSNKLYAIDEAIATVKTGATAKFNESIDVAINLGVDPRKSDQVVRGAVVLPKGTGKPLALLCSPKALTQMLLVKPVLILLVWKSWLTK